MSLSYNLLMNRQSYNQVETPTISQQNNKNLANRFKFNKSMLKLHPTSSLKATLQTKIVEDIHQTTVVNKYRCPKSKTQQNSPISNKITTINAIRFPQLCSSGNTLAKHQLLLKQTQGHVERDVAKTAIIIDSLMKYLKDQTEPRNHFRQQKRVINLTEESNEFFQCQKTRRSKRPKIVKNSITKKFFQVDKERKIQSEDRCRKINNSLINEKIGDYTFYGGKLYPIKMETEGPIANKDELNQMRVNRLSKKRI